VEQRCRDRQALKIEGSRTVFLSYASEDVDAARRICEALRAAGVEVWFDQSELRGGDAWEHEIRGRIRECTLFIPVISGHTQERPEGFFRLEWKLAVDRSHLMAVEKSFLVPVVTHDISEATALVPDRFREVQWTYLTEGAPTQAFVERIARLLNHPVAARGMSAALSDTTAGTPPRRRAASPRRWWVAGALGVALVAGAGLWISSSLLHPWRNPVADAKFSRLTELSGNERAAAISRDGKLAAFLTDHDGTTAAWLTTIGSGMYRNLTPGSNLELINPEIRTLGFAPDGTFVTIWARRSDGAPAGEVSILAEPTAGGPLRPYLPEAAEVAWSSDGGQLVYHTAAPGDPLFVRKAHDSAATRIYTAPAGVHCHFPIWSPDSSYIYFARGIPPDAWDVWRIRPSGADLERITFHNSLVSNPVMLDGTTLLYLATEPDGSGPWLYGIDLKQRVPHRLSLGLERYTSLASSDGGHRLLATLTSSESSVWRLAPASSGTVSTASRVSAEGSSALSPRLGPNYLLYVSRRSGHEGIWKVADATSRELWSDGHQLIVGAPAVSPDGRRIAFTAADGPRTLLYVMDSNGGAVRVITDSLSLRGNPAWGPDGQTIVSAAMTDGEPRVTTIYLNGRPPQALVPEYSIDPVWSPDGKFLIYSGADSGTTFPVRAATADGRPYGMQTLILPRGARRLVFWRATPAVVVLRGEMDHKQFWLIDLRTGSERQLTNLAFGVTTGDFDVAADGAQIVFDRTVDTSKIALIERTR